jgi:ABC-type transport system substrate-binding protein
VREHDVNKASFELKTNQGNPTREQILTLVQADGADIVDPERRFDAFVIGWSADFNLDDRILFACSQLDGPYQWASYCNPRVDEILDRVAMMEDRSRALPLWHEYQEILQDSAVGAAVHVPLLRRTCECGARAGARRADGHPG